MNQDENICRICLKRQDTLFSLFRSRHGSSPYEKLLSKTNLKIEFNDAGPSSICSQCLIDLDTTVSFLEKCELSNQILAERIVVVSNADEEYSICKNYDNELEEKKALELEHVNYDVPTIVNELDSPNDTKEVKLSVPVTHKCPECGSKRRCRHWSPQASYTCQYCDKEFNKKYNFQIHLKRHLGERDWACSECGALQLTESLAQRHCQPKALRQCPMPDCGKTFTNNTNLHAHIRTHSGERPFECHDCGKGFSSKKTLKCHVRIHTGEKPYMCQVCGARFMWNHIAAHMCVHGAGAGARRHACGRGGCARRFATAAALRSHSRTHAPARSFSCSSCSAAYKFKQSLNRHVRKRHGAAAAAAGAKCQ